jgi:hypothetical protein
VGDYRSKAAQEWPYGTRGLVEEPDEAARVAARDARIKAYRERERARVVAAFDRFLERMFDDPFGERPEWNESAAFLPIYQAAETFVCCPMRMTFDNVAHQCAGEKGVPHEHSYPTAPVRPGDADYCGGDLAHPPHRVGTAPGCIACPTACPGVPHRGHTKSGTPCPIETVGIHQKAHYGVPEIAECGAWCADGPGGLCTLDAGHPGEHGGVHRNPDYVAVEVLGPGGGAPGAGGGGGKGGSHECPPDGQTCSHPLHPDYVAPKCKIELERSGAWAMHTNPPDDACGCNSRIDCTRAGARDL